MPAADVSVWSPSVEHRSHPYGERGVFSSLEEVCKRANKGAVSPKVRMWAIECLDRARKERGLKMSTEKQRAEVLLKAVQQKLWVPDPVGTEWMAGTHLMACDPTKDGVCFRGGDCFPEGTLLLREGHEPIEIEHVEPGMKIWGLDRWSEVQAVKYKGVLSVDVITLNNGSEVKLTSDHHVYVLDCQKHPMLTDEGEAKTLPEDYFWRGGGAEKTRWGCSCSAEHRVEKRCRVSELREGMIVPTPERIPFGDDSHPDAPETADHAYVEGLYISDGWADYRKNAKFSISGQDGCPKEDQKRDVQQICERLGINTGWERKWINVYGKPWTLKMQRMGRYAPEKRALTINLGEANAAQLLRGIMADSGANTKGRSHTFTTTSRELAIQTRLLHKMFGITCGKRYIENHGGLGKNPIYRLGVRHPERVDGRRAWLLKVKNIERDVAEVPCWDVQTDDHRVYLAEHDVTVSQCDDLVILAAACFISCGLYTCVVGHAYDKKKQIQHVLTTVYAGGRWYYADPSTDLALGECVTFSRERVYSLPNVQMLCDDSVCFKSPRSFIPEKNNFVVKGDFVGVNGVPGTGVPDDAWIVDSAVTHDGRVLGMVGQSAEGDVQIEASAEIYDDTQKAALKEAKKMKWPPSDEQVENVAAVAGGSAAAVACSMAGAPAASPICGKIGAEISRFVTDKVIDGLKKIFVRRNKKAWADYHTRVAQSETLFAGADLAFEYARVQGTALTEIVDSLEALHVDFYGSSSGENRNDWRRALAFVGAPISERPGLTAPDGKPEFNFALNVHQEWRDFFERVRPALTTDHKGNLVFGDFAQRQIRDFFAELTQRLDADIETTGDAANLLATKMAADAVATKAAEATGLTTRFRLRAGSPRGSKSSSGGGWLLVAAVAGGVAWWVWG